MKKEQYRYDTVYGNALYEIDEDQTAYIFVGKFPGLSKKEAIEEGGKIMLDEKETLELDADCKICGHPAVNGSPLCVDCLIATVNSFAPSYDIAQAKLKEAEKMLKVCRGQLDDVLAYGYKQNQEIAKLNRTIKELMDDVHGRDPENG